VDGPERRAAAGLRRRDAFGHPPGDRRGLAHRAAASSPASRAWCATSGSAEELAQERWSPRSSTGRATACPTTRGPGS
jgi:hypothetical protein